VLEDAGFLLCEDDYLPGPFRESLEQLGFLTLAVFWATPNLLLAIGFKCRWDERYEISLA
jgi:hypothetical protein